MLLYYISQPSEDGETPTLTKYIQKISDMEKEWETRSALHTAAVEQAAHDKHLLYTAPRNPTFELTFPEYVSIECGRVC